MHQLLNKSLDKQIPTQPKWTLASLLTIGADFEAWSPSLVGDDSSKLGLNELPIHKASI